ncbi:SRPBCC family protein [Phyllobacterium zundukense]|uniref:Polyketide cyclase n=1 Tax=Phyllobacterium zundukense TaxID=1867719 RepID=A0A2N9VRS7_9HYPH|nr:SRPBCC family protein [Phyllobacterium zundukense]ATU92619.1 polyketide cyclase [Phyllobacterium zundukense]PIO42195.1 polyketide cyclase [Phyllobacterium zundukense]
MATHEARTLQISIGRNWRDVYDFVSVPENLPQWASGLTSGLQKSGGEWLADGPAGKLRLRFAPENKLGVLDHWVVLETGEEVYIPLRVVANGENCEVIFTLFRLPGMDDEKFTADAAWVMRDLQALKDLLEAQLIG